MLLRERWWTLDVLKLESLLLENICWFSFQHFSLDSHSYVFIRVQPYSQPYVGYSLMFPGFLLKAKLSLRVSLRMTLAPYSAPCSQTCPYFCRLTTLPCTSLSPLTWECPCEAWRFSTNHWPLTSTAPRFLTPAHPQQPFSTQPTLLPPPHCAPPSLFLWHFLCVAGWSYKLLIFLALTSSPSWHPPRPPSQFMRKKHIPYFFNEHLHVFSTFVFLVLSCFDLVWCFQSTTD